ncbi:uncharacterized protein LOC114957500 [Acropora millepora]|uniref:uncharacterized protein LOC114957500 n=1 Tax=Acropora millepora TaxID=45264 RepID=UPI001CF158C0|nr:uncharacterized protein LOC114957500 [Acropora millepora]
MGYTRVLLMAIIVAMTTEKAWSYISYDVQSTIVSLMDQRGYTALQKVRLTRDNVRPIFRKDISGKAPPYYEISAGGQYYVFSASSRTGDHRLVDSGKGIRPTELLNNQALIKGETCDKYYRITAVSGLYTCENSEGLLVASTYDFVSDSLVDNVNLKNKTYYYHLQTNLRLNLSEFNKEWQDLYKETKDSAEWTTEQILTEKKQHTNITRYAEEALRPGSTVKVALGSRFSNVSIRVTGTGRNTSDDDEPLEEWQRRLCQVLDRVCLNGSKKINKEAIEVAPNGISYIKLSVSDDKDRVRKILQNAEVEFMIEFHISEDGRHLLVRKRFAIDLSPSRKRRWSTWKSFSVPQEWKFLDYNQHYCCGCICGPGAWARSLAFYDRLAHGSSSYGYSKDVYCCKIGVTRFLSCMSGCGPVAWAQIFAYYDRLADSSSSYGYSKDLYRCKSGIAGSSSCTAPWKMTPAVKSYIEEIRCQVGTFCLFGAGATTHWDMKSSELKSFYSSRQSGGTIHGYTSWWFSFPGIYREWIRNEAIEAVKQGYPAIVGFWSGATQHYAVATKYRFRYRRYRTCWWFFGWHCGSWKKEYDHELYYHMGWGGSGNGWRTAKAFSAFVAKK